MNGGGREPGNQLSLIKPLISPEGENSKSTNPGLGSKPEQRPVDYPLSRRLFECNESPDRVTYGGYAIRWQTA